MHTLLRRPSVAVALVAVVALLGSACNRTPADPAEALAAAVKATFADSYHYEASVEADPAALRAVGADAAQTAAFLSGLALEGDVAGDATSLTVRILGIDALEIRRVSAEEVFIRLAAQQLLAASGQAALGDPALITAALEQLEASDAMRAAVLGALDGSWVGVEGALDAAAVQRALGVEASATSETSAEDLVAALGGDLAGAIERYVTIDGEPLDLDGGARYRVSLAMRDLLRNVLTVQAEAAGDDPGQIEADLAGLAETVPGTIDVIDGKVTSVRIDIAGAVEDRPSEGAIELVILLSDHGGVTGLSAPEEAVTVPADDFLDTLARLSEFAGTPVG